MWISERFLVHSLGTTKNLYFTLLPVPRQTSGEKAGPQIFQHLSLDMLPKILRPKTLISLYICSYLAVENVATKKHHHLLGLTYEAKTEQKEVDSMSIFWGRYILISPKTFRNGCWPSSRARNWRQRDALDDALMVTTTSHQVRWRCNALPQDMLICNETTTPNKWKQRIHIEKLYPISPPSWSKKGMYRRSLLRALNKSSKFAYYHYINYI